MAGKLTVQAFKEALERQQPRKTEIDKLTLDLNKSLRQCGFAFVILIAAVLLLLFTRP